MPSDTPKSEEEAAARAANRAVGQDTPSKWYVLSKLLLILTQAIFLCLYLDNTITWSGFAVFAPWIVYEAESLVYRLMNWKQRYTGYMRTQKQDYDKKHAELYFIYRDNMWGILNLALALLCAAKISVSDGIYLFPVSWFIVAVPIWIGYILQLLDAVSG
jgi:hypothetical protein